MAGLVPAIPISRAPCPTKRDARDTSAFTRVFRRAMPAHDRGEVRESQPNQSNKRKPPMADPYADLRREIAVANRILANEGIIDAFGHISARHPTDPNRYFISRHRASELVEPSDILEMTLDSKPVHATNVRLYSEMVIHGEIYKVRPDVNSVCHHHAPSVLPFCATGVELIPLFHLGGTLGTKVPFWDSRDEFGDTNLLVRTPEEGASHARALGPHFMLLLRRHGASLAGKSVRECVFRSIYTTRNA